MAKLLATDETLNKVSGNLDKIAGYLGVMAANDLEAMVSDPESFHKLIQSGLAPEVLSVGDQIVIPHSEYGAIAWDIIGFDHDKDASGLYDHSITVQTHNIITRMQFDQRENEVATEGTFSSEYSYYIQGADSDHFTYLKPGTDYQVGAAIPSDQTYYHSAIQDTTGYIVRYGYNNWEHSAIRQYLNSEADADKWWNAKHAGDVAPTYASKAGFLKGLDAEFKKIIGTTVKKTALNTITDGGGSVELTEKIFLLSRTEVSGGNENNIAEGEAYEYYSRLVGSVTTGANNGRIKRDLNGNIGWWGLRDPYTGFSYDVRYCGYDGVIYVYGNAYGGDRGLSPACILR